MRKIVKHVVVGGLGLAALIGTAAVNLAMPPSKDANGRIYCQCGCATKAGYKELDWEMTGSCSSNGKACRATFDGGKTFHSGTLNNCATCEAKPPVNTGWTCTPTLKISPNITPATPQGTLRQR